MKMPLILFFFAISSSAIAATSRDCNELKSEQIRLALTASNLANVNTTRTPDGGAYRPYLISSCSSGHCDVKRDGRAPVMKYLPDHPDADVNGYVAFPNIDAKAEYATFNIAATKLKLLGKSGVCGTRTVDNGDSILLSYSETKTGIKEDIFNFDREHQVVSWGRSDAKGAHTTANFKPDGEIVSYR